MDATTPNALKQALRSLSHQELLDLIFQLSEESSEVLQLLLATVSISPEIVKQQPRDDRQVQEFKEEVDNFFEELSNSLQDKYERENYYDCEDKEDEEPPELDSLFETVKTCNLEDQIEIFWHIIISGNDWLENAEYHIGTEQIQRALGLFAEAVVKLELAPLKKRLYFNSLIAALDWPMCGYGEITNAIKNALDIICVVPEDYRYLIEQFENNQDELSVDWIAGYYLKLGDDENYLWIRQANLHTEAHYLELADYWLQKGERSRYLATLEQWISELTQKPSESEFNGGYYSYDSSNPNTVLYKLAEEYRQQQDAENLCRILMTTAEYLKVTLDLYKEIQTISANLGTWQQLQPRLLILAQRNSQTLAEIYLYEQSWDAVIELGDRQDCYERVRIFIAEGIKQHRPENSIKIYEQLVQYYIDQKNRNSYRIAARHANEIKSIYLSILKNTVGWQNYINDIREKYRGYPALKDEFRQL